VAAVSVATISARVLRWQPQVEAAALRWALDPWLLLAIVAQESAGESGAMRPEPAWWGRYGANVIKAALASVSRSDDRWVRYPEIASASYGLCQVLYPVAAEVGVSLRYPTDLCVPEIGLDVGARVLVRCLKHAAAAGAPDLIRGALLRYNGGSRPQYPDEVLAWRDALRTVAQAAPA